MTNQRMWDLIRYQRAELHEAGLITDDEYAELAKDHAAVKRLEDYDKALIEAKQSALLKAKKEVYKAVSSAIGGDR